jgi:hypothetical protein
MIDHTELKTELDTDPTGLGYNSENAEDAARLNEVRAGIIVSVSSAPVVGVIEAIVPAEWIGLTDAQRAGLGLYATQETINPNAPNITDAFSSFFAPGPTRTALIALQTREGSRAEELWGENARITYEDLRIARAL